MTPRAGSDRRATRGAWRCFPSDWGNLGAAAHARDVTTARPTRPFNDPTANARRETTGVRPRSIGDLVPVKRARFRTTDDRPTTTARNGT